MKLDRVLRATIAAILLLLFVLALAAVIFITESALNVWDRLREAPPYVLYVYAGTILLLVVVAIWLTVRLLVRRKPRSETAPPLNRDSIEARLRDAERDGVDVSEARGELAELAARQQQGALHLCFFGEISTGKSSLIKALVPDAEISIDVRGGSTVDIRHYRWKSDEANEILLTDVPGVAGLDAEFKTLARQEASRAHVVLFVCEGDLTRAERDELAELVALDKPLVLVMNKSDRYDATEQAILLERLLDHLDDIGSELNRDRVVAVSAGGTVEVVEQRPGVDEQIVRRERPADIGVLVVALDRLLSGDRASLDVKRTRAVFALASDKLANAEAAYREQRAGQILRASTRKAVIGALAAVSPGTDVVIQGYVGTTMTRELCRLFGVAPRDLDIEEFLDLSESRAGKALPIALAVAGNGLKAFPGIGTVAGGLVHAIAYGLIFDALGRSLVRTLEEHGALKPDVAAAEFEESLGEHIQTRVEQVAKIAVAESTRRRSDEQ
ncbi:MAG: GTPase [Pseudomonadota bacterium]